MPYSIKTDAADCKGYAVVDENGETVACHTNRKDAVLNQRALYANEPDAARKENPTVSDVHVDSAMGRVRIKRPTFSKNVDVLIAQHYKLHNKTNNPSEAQLYVHHNILDEVQKAGMDCYCACGNWSQPLVINNITTDLQTLQKSKNPSLAPVKQIIETGINSGYKFADVLQMLDIGGYMMVVRPKEIIQTPTEPMDVEDSLSKSILAKIKDLLNKVSEPSLAGSVAEGGTATFKADTPQSFVPPKAVQEEAQRALNWIKDGFAGDNFTDVGRARASQLANGEGVSRDTIARMKSFLARHAVDSHGEGYRPGEPGFPSPGRVAYAAWGGEAAKSWVDKIFRQYDLAKSYGDVETVFKADEKRFTLGPWYIPDRADAHGEWTDTSELQNALWNYVKSGDRRIRLQHNKNVVAGEWVETMTWPYPVTVPITKADGSMGEHTYPTGTVFMGVQWEPWAWEMVKAGKLTGYSIGGKAERVLVDLPEEIVAKESSFKVGDAVSWNSSGGIAQGKIERIIRDGKLNIPNSSFTINGTKDDPAALIRITRNGKETETLVGHKMSTLKKKLDNLDKANPYRDGSTGRFTTGGGGMGAGVASSILDRVKANGGLSVNMVNGSEPTSGYMVAKGTEYGKTVSAEDFYDPEKGPKILADYMKDNKADLATGKNYLGLWHNTEDGKVYLDVSENILDRGAAITAGQSRDQISIWDVANFAEVQTGGTGVTKQEVGSRGNPGKHLNNDGR